MVKAVCNNSSDTSSTGNLFNKERYSNFSGNDIGEIFDELELRGFCNIRTSAYISNNCIFDILENNNLIGVILIKSNDIHVKFSKSISML